MFGKIFWKIFLGNALLLTGMLVAAVWLITVEIDRFYEEDLTGTLHSQAQMLSNLTHSRMDRAHASELQRIAAQIGRDDPADVRVTFIAADGGVLGDSEADPARMELHLDRRETQDALRSGWGHETRLSQTLGRLMKYVAVRVGPPENPIGVVRLAMPLRTIGQRFESIRRLAWRITAIALATALLFAMGLARLWSHPIRQIMLTARSLSRGNLSARVRVSGHDELAALSRSLNQMRDHLAEQLETIDHQHRTLQALVTQLREGVIVSDQQGRVVLMNPAARRLMGANPGGGERDVTAGARVEQCVPHNVLQRMLLDESPNPAVRQVTVPGPLEDGSRNTLLASAADMTLPTRKAAGGSGRLTGRLLVLTDITPLARTIQVKADFAANASHELRTPLAGIRAAVETLLAVDLSREASAARQFVAVIDRQSSRMQAMVSDLLNLSRIESCPARFTPARVDVRELLAELQRRFSAHLESKNLEWRADVADGALEIFVNPDLLRLALENLIDNAIKFTDEGGRIAVRFGIEAAPARPKVVFEVADTGCGIPAAEQERVFERFYQVERARSGPDRGTGLGLSIVRHAVAAMHGVVRLTSTVGEGTTVTVSLPQTGS